MYYDPDGRPIGPDEWSTLFELRKADPDDSWWRRRSRAPGGLVSTVWLGLDHSYVPGRPLYWETMIFGCYDRDEDQWRHPSREAALAVHRSVVRDLWLAHAARTCVAAVVLAAVVAVAVIAG